MFKILAILLLIWVFFKALGQIFKTVFGITDSNRSTRYANHGKKQKDGINVDYDPRQKGGKGYTGGEYVDYEEVE